MNPWHNARLLNQLSTWLMIAMLLASDDQEAEK